jgi:exonuclease III
LSPPAVDGFILSERFLYRVRKCEIRQEVKYKFWADKDVMGRGALSDHWPVWLSLEMAEL